MKLKSRHFENYPISGNQKPLRAFFTHIWGYFVQCDYTLLRMTDHYIKTVWDVIARSVLCDEAIPRLSSWPDKREIASPKNGSQ
jgi:hypothetical protein